MSFAALDRQALAGVRQRHEAGLFDFADERLVARRGESPGRSRPRSRASDMSMRCSQNVQVRTVQTRVPGEPRQSGAVLQDDVDVELGLAACHRLDELADRGTEAADEFLVLTRRRVVDLGTPGSRTPAGASSVSEASRCVLRMAISAAIQPPSSGRRVHVA